MVPCAVRTWHVETRSVSFLVETQNQGQRFVMVWPENHSEGFHRFGLKIGDDGFCRFDLNSGGEGFPVWASKLTALVW
jgi:hypothetical protein